MIDIAKIEFQVNGKPPKKYGANSMWNKETEVQCLVLLRQKAAIAMKEASLNSPFSVCVNHRNSAKRN